MLMSASPVSDASRGSVSTLRDRVLWLTNLMAPYRVPVWEAMGREVDLCVWLLENSQRFRRSARNRGADWMPARELPISVSEVPTVRLGTGENGHYLALRRIIRCSTGLRAVVMGGWDSPAYWQALVEARHAGIGTVAFYESTLASHRHRAGLIAGARRKFFSMVDRVVVPGPSSADAVLSMGVPEERVRIGFNAVDVEVIYADATQARRERIDAEDPRVHRFIYLGQLIPRKNVAGVLRALAGQASNSWSFEIVGCGSEEQSLRELANQLGISSRVSFAGPVAYSELGETLARNDTLVLFSKEEVWGLVVNEALAAGLSVVVSDVCGVARSVDGMRGVVVVASNDEAALAGALSRAISVPKGLIDRPAILEYTPQRFAGVFLDAIRDLGISHRR